MHLTGKNDMNYMWNNKKEKYNIKAGVFYVMISINSTEFSFETKLIYMEGKLFFFSSQRGYFWSIFIPKKINIIQ